LELASLIALNMARKKPTNHGNRPPKKGGQKPRPQSIDTSKRESAAARPSSNELWLFGKHAVLAALNNPERHIKRLVMTRRSADAYKGEISNLPNLKENLNAELVDQDKLTQLLPPEALHQGIAAHVAPLPGRHIDDVCEIIPDRKNLILLLDQVTDPHNVGAIIRSAAAFGAKAIITTDRNAPAESGTLAKSASGTLELLPWVRVTNLSRALDQLAEMGYWRLGLDGHAKQSVEQIDMGNNIALILGAEGKGMRKGTADHCDALIKLPISENVESLNVSNAAAVALYALGR